MLLLYILLVTRKEEVLYSAIHLIIAIATIFAIIFYDEYIKLRASRPKFNYHCYTYASPATCSINLAEKYTTIITTYINENDIVPRLSYGASCDLKLLVKSANEILHSKAPLKEKMETLDSIRKHQQHTSDHPKVYIPGEILYTYKVTRAQAKTSLETQPTNSPMGSGMNLEKCSPSKYVDLDVGHYVVERSSRMYFDSMHLKFNLLRHHMLDKYESSLSKSVEWLNKNSFT